MSKRVRVHFNLRKPNFVIRGCPKRVGDMTYTDKVCVRNCRFIVSEPRRDACRREGERQVHAWIEGELCDCGEIDGKPIRYNPYDLDGFAFVGDTRALKTADHVAMRTVNGKPVSLARNAR